MYNIFTLINTYYKGDIMTKVTKYLTLVMVFLYSQFSFAHMRCDDFPSSNSHIKEVICNDDYTECFETTYLNPDVCKTESITLQLGKNIPNEEESIEPTNTPNKKASRIRRQLRERERWD